MSWEAGGGPVGFRDRLARAAGAHGPLCVGIDPHPELLAAWSLPDDADGVERFARTVVDALAGHVALLKPQVALFESHGAAGMTALERTLAHARDAGVLTVADAKRGDIGSTMTAYARAWLAPGAPLAADAVTLSPYLGVGALTPALELAAAHGRGVFVLARTSNPEGASVQSAQTFGPGPGGAPRGVREVAQGVVDALRDAPGAGVGVGGVVVGATAGTAGRAHGVDLSGLTAPVLVPGLGAQGATPDDVAAAFGDAAGPVIPVSARDILAAGPGTGALRDAADVLNAALRERDLPRGPGA